MKRRWSPDDRQRFADRDILKASRIPGKRRPAPDASEWPSGAASESSAPEVPEDDLRPLDGHTEANPAIPDPAAPETDAGEW